MKFLGLANRVEKAAVAIFGIAAVIFLVASFTESRFAFLVLVDLNPAPVPQGNAVLILALYCFAAVIYLLVLSFLKDPSAWFLLTFSLAWLWLAVTIAIDNLNATLDTTAAVKTNGRLINVREATGRHARGKVLTFDLGEASLQTHRYEVGDRYQLVSISNDGTRVDFYMCAGYFRKPYVCSRKL